MSKSILQIIYTCSKKKKRQIFEKWDRSKSRPSCKSYSPCKIPTLGQKLKLKKKNVKIHSTNHWQLFCTKNRPKKHQIFEKWDRSKSRPSCKGYSPCKIITLGQKLKFQKTLHNPFYKSFPLVLCKKPLEKNTKYSRNKTILKIGHHAKALAHAKSSL